MDSPTPRPVISAIYGWPWRAVLDRLPAGLEAQPIEQADYYDALNCLPPALHLSDGFLLGEAAGHRVCTILGCAGAPPTPTYATFFCRTIVEQGREVERHFKASLALSKAEFYVIRHLNLCGLLVERWYQRTGCAAWLAYLYQPEKKTRLPMGYAPTMQEARAQARHQWAGATRAMQANMEERLSIVPLTADEASEMAEWFAAPWGAAT